MVKFLRFVNIMLSVFLFFLTIFELFKAKYENEIEENRKIYNANKHLFLGSSLEEYVD